MFGLRFGLAGAVRRAVDRLTGTTEGDEAQETSRSTSGRTVRRSARLRSPWRSFADETPPPPVVQRSSETQPSDDLGGVRQDLTEDDDDADEIVHLGDEQQNVQGGEESVKQTVKAAEVKSSPPNHERFETFPTTLEAFGYAFVGGKLRSIETGEPFIFEVIPGDRKYNQKHYEALGETVTEAVYGLLESEAGLRRVHLSGGGGGLAESVGRLTRSQKGGVGFFFASADACTNEHCLVLLIHGSGAVRAGQWARRLIINGSLDEGTQLPYIAKCMERGFGVAVLNTNQRFDTDRRKIPGSEDPSSHAAQVWRAFVQRAAAKHIVIVAHSAGGVVTTDLARHFPEQFVKRVAAVAFTDSVHYVSNEKRRTRPWRHMLTVARNWVCSREPLDTPLEDNFMDVSRVSAGTTSHERTSTAAIESVFRFVDEQLRGRADLPEIDLAAAVGSPSSADGADQSFSATSTISTIDDSSFTASDCGSPLNPAASPLIQAVPALSLAAPPLIQGDDSLNQGGETLNQGGETLNQGGETLNQGDDTLNQGVDWQPPREAAPGQLEADESAASDTPPITGDTAASAEVGEMESSEVVEPESSVEILEQPESLADQASGVLGQPRKLAAARRHSGEPAEKKMREHEEM